MNKALNFSTLLSSLQRAASDQRTWYDGRRAPAITTAVQIFRF